MRKAEEIAATISEKNQQIRDRVCNNQRTLLEEKIEVEARRLESSEDFSTQTEMFQVEITPEEIHGTFDGKEIMEEHLLTEILDELDNSGFEVILVGDCYNIVIKPQE